MSIFEELAEKALSDEYFKELFLKAEMLASSRFFNTIKNTLDEKELTDLLRFSDILSRSSNYDAKNKSYKIISLLVDDYKGDALFRTFANSILTKLGNFPAIKLIQKYSESSDSQSIELTLERNVKELYQRIPNSDFIFTDDQYAIFENLRNSNHYSFSGPTSLGKSFILNAFIRTLISEDKANENIIILVPTRALINQTLINLKKEFSDVEEYRVLSHPTVPETFKNNNSRYIFIFTPERLIAYLSEKANPRIGYLFVDEAQKVVSERDARSPLYYHAILQAERKSIRLYFASPNIPNPDIFLKLFRKSTEEAISIKSSPVSQNRFFLDLIEKRCILFSDVETERNIPLDFSDCTFQYWLRKLSNDNASIVYCNTKSDTIEYALNFSKDLPNKNDEKIDEVISVIQEHLHKEYFLIDCLKKGVAFHFGNLPQRIREKVEALFIEKSIDYLFCTSTLLEGVNLPAKNIFILSNAIGLAKFSDIDFWNLSGRAGRLSKELSGNIICTRVENKNNRWKNPEKDLDVVKSKAISPIKPLITSGKKSFFKNVEASLANENFTRKKASSNEKDIWNHYANIALIHEIRSDNSILRSNFISRNENAEELLKSISRKNSVPERILSAYSVIKAKYQNKAFLTNDSENLILSDDTSYKIVLKALEYLSEIYAWDVEESSGKDPMYRSKDSLKYYAVLMSNWMNSTPLSMMISDSINYYTSKGEIWNTDQLVKFSPKNKYHINLVINEIISNVDNVLRFKLKNYFGNYYDILSEKLGVGNAGRNWGEFLEYGTTDPRIIELQNIGMPRHMANYLLNNYPQFFKFDRGVLVSFEKSNLINEMDENSVEFKELIEVV